MKVNGTNGLQLEALFIVKSLQLQFLETMSIKEQIKINQE